MFPKVSVILGLLIIFAISAYLLSPIPQWDSYHHFSDNRTLFAIDNFMNVVSNIGFLVFGSYGLFSIFQKTIFDNKLDPIPYGLFFLSIIFVGVGSCYYHWDPTTERLFWDRLPMSIAFMSFFSAIICDRIYKKIGVFFVLPVLISFGVYSVIYWHETEIMGVGDLRLYGLVQYFPMLAIPVILFLFPDYRYTPSSPIIWILTLYVLAKICEYFDSNILNLSNNILSGHSLKHLTASLSVFFVLRMLAKSKRGVSF